MTRLPLCCFSLFLLFLSPVYPQKPGKITVELANEIARDIWAKTGSHKTCPQVIFEKDDRLACFSETFRGDVIRICPERVIPFLEAQFGADAADALAVIIGHEIGHALKGEYGKRFGVWGDDKDAELVADQFGLMASWYAGYTKALVVFDRIFSMPAMRTGGQYPSIAERKMANENLLESSARRVELFHAANCLTLTGNNNALDLAIAAYRDAGAGLVPLREIEYNLGLAFFLKTLARSDGVRWVFPLELSDPGALRIRGGDGQRYTVDRTLLDSARTHFNTAIRINKNDFKAWLGNRCVDILTGGEARQRAVSEALQHETKTGFPEQRCQAKMVRALALLLDGKKLEGEVLLEEVERRCADARISGYARANLRLLQEANVETAYSGEPPNKCSPEAMDGVRTLADAVQRASGPVQPLGSTFRLFREKTGERFLLVFKSVAFSCAVQEAEPQRTCACIQKNTTSWPTGSGEYRLVKGDGAYFVSWSPKNEKPVCFRVFMSF